MNNDTTENIQNELPDPTHLARNGKIARLPKHIRQQLNWRLQDREPTKELADWLNNLPEVKTMLAAEFDNRPIRVQNLYEWRNGGYRDWLQQQEAFAFVQSVQTDAAELQACAEGALGDKLGLWLMARYFAAARSTTDEHGCMDWKVLRELTRDVSVLRRGDMWSQRMQLEREKFAHAKAQDERDREREFWQQAAQPEICEKITKRYEGQADKVAWAGYQMFGEFWDGPMPPGAPPLTEKQAAKVLASAEARAQYTAEAAARAAEELKRVREDLASVECEMENGEAEETENIQHPTPNIQHPEETSANAECGTANAEPAAVNPPNPEPGTGNSEFEKGNLEPKKTGTFRVIPSDSESKGKATKPKQPKGGSSGQSNGSANKKGG